MIINPTSELKRITIKVMEDFQPRHAGTGCHTAWNGEWAKVLHQKFIDQHGVEEWIAIPEQ